MKEILTTLATLLLASTITSSASPRGLTKEILPPLYHIPWKRTIEVGYIEDDQTYAPIKSQIMDGTCFDYW